MCLLHVLGTWSWGCLELELWFVLSFWSKLCATFVFLVRVRAMWMLEFLFVLWVGFLVWCLVMLHLVYAEVKRLKTTTVQGVEKGINTEESPAPTSLLRRQAASQTEWGDLEFHLGQHGKAFHRQGCHYIGRGSKTYHLCQICHYR